MALKRLVRVHRPVTGSRHRQEIFDNIMGTAPQREHPKRARGVRLVPNNGFSTVALESPLQALPGVLVGVWNLALLRTCLLLGLELYV